LRLREIRVKKGKKKKHLENRGKMVKSRVLNYNEGVSGKYSRVIVLGGRRRMHFCRLWSFLVVYVTKEKKKLVEKEMKTYQQVPKGSRMCTKGGLSLVP